MTKSRTVLVVDDSVSMRHLVSQTLRSLSFETHEAPDALTALKLLQSVNNVDLVITDLNMPLMDGITFLKKVREHQELKYVPVLMLTTETRDDFKSMARQAGATGWLVKPFDSQKLAAVVRRILP
jgi:two-component system, chemotaxis family, chemotaxis protein CheY